jgi:hypothetical protein
MSVRMLDEDGVQGGCSVCGDRCLLLVQHWVLDAAAYCMESVNVACNVACCAGCLYLPIACCAASANQSWSPPELLNYAPSIRARREAGACCSNDYQM